MTTDSAPRPTYGNWIRQRSPGLGGVGILGMVIGLGGLITVMVTLMTFGLKVAAVMAVLVAVTFALGGTPLGVALAAIIGFQREKKNLEHQWRSGVFSFNKVPSVRLPGMLGATSLLERDDVYGSPFVVIKNPRAGGLYTIVARCTSEGPSMQDQDRLNSWVAGYGRVLSSLSAEVGIVCAKAINDTAPDPGGRLGAQVRALRSPNSPDVARSVMDEIVATYPASASDNLTYVELTFSGRSLSKRGRDADILSELARKVPGLMGQLVEAGGGSVEMMTAPALTKAIRAAYDPAAQRFIEQAELAGVEHDIDWSQAGPVADQNGWDHYRHDSGVSVTWEMHEPPRSAVSELSLSGLLNPHSDFVRKRIALIYRPHTPEEGAKTAERDASTALFVSQSSKKRASASSKVAVRATEQTRQEVATGHSLTRFSILLTATVSSEDDLLQATSTIESRAGAVPLRVRRCYGSQSSAFAATLPVGFVPWEHTAIPSKILELM